MVEPTCVKLSFNYISKGQKKSTLILETRIFKLVAATPSSQGKEISSFQMSQSQWSKSLKRKASTALIFMQTSRYQSGMQDILSPLNTED